MAEPPSLPSNVGARLSLVAAERPDAVAVAVPAGRSRAGKREYRTLTFRELDEDSNRLASALLEWGVPRGARLALLVRMGRDFISLVFALLKAGMVQVLIDPGMGRRHMVRCLAEAEPEGFIGIPAAQAVRLLLRHKFPRARWNVTAGNSWWHGGGPTVQLFRDAGDPRFTAADTTADDEAAIIFTTGSTGPPKGVLYRHGTFVRQAEEIQRQYGIEPGEVDIPGFPLFGLFNCVMGVTTVVPDMDPTRPAEVDPRNILEAAADWQATQAFGSPALWNTVGRYCEQHGAKIPSLRRILSAGAPVPPHVISRVLEAIHPEGEFHTPYGATEALPVATISGHEVLEETAARSAEGAGTCVGRRFPGIQWQIIRISEESILRINEAEPLPIGEIGELIVSGPVVTRQYVTRTENNALHKIADGDRIWHRMGDVGYLDSADRFWFCGRKNHRVVTAEETLFTVPCEAIVNSHPSVYRSALVGLGPRGAQRPVVVVECWPEHRPRNEAAWKRLQGELAERTSLHEHTRMLREFLRIRALPVDIRHNSKIFREKVAVWAARRV